MRDAEPEQVTLLLHRARDGDEEALHALFPLVYDSLKRLSRRELRREGGDPILSTTGLVHEAYVKLSPGTDVPWNDRAHFYAVAARAMRQVLVDRARRRDAEKREGRWSRLTLSGRHARFQVRWDELLALDEALDRLDALNRRLRQVVELRFFGGLSEREVAGVLGVSARTVRRDWTKARLFLHRELHPEGEAG
jgi:RNA polymerase sigma factor (TIGR02999 family)